MLTEAFEGDYKHCMSILKLLRQFDAHLGPGPDIPDVPPGHVRYKGLKI